MILNRYPSVLFIFIICNLSLSVKSAYSTEDYQRFLIALYNTLNGIGLTECQETSSQASIHPSSITDTKKILEMSELKKQIDAAHNGTECFFYLKIDDSEQLRSQTPLMTNDSDSEVEKEFKNSAWLGVRDKLNTNKRDQSEKRTARILLNTMAMTEPVTLSESGAAHEKDIDLIPMQKRKRHGMETHICKGCNVQQTSIYALIRDKYPNRSYQPRAALAQNFQQFTRIFSAKKSLDASLSQLRDRLSR
jgi:ribosomal protein S13